MSNSPYNPSALSSIDLRSEEVRQMIYDAYENMRQMVEFAVAAWPDLGAGKGREIGGIDYSCQQFSVLLGIAPPYQRRFHSDGCAIVTEDTEFAGHDTQPGCEFSEDEENEDENEDENETDPQERAYDAKYDDQEGK